MSSRKEMSNSGIIGKIQYLSVWNLYSFKSFSILKGSTKVYTKSGFKLKEFISALPGGSRTSPTNSTILDCLWDEYKRMFYVLDVLSWNGLQLIGCEVSSWSSV